VGTESKTIGKASSPIRVETKSVETAAPKAAGVITGQCDVLDKSAAALAVIEGKMMELTRAGVELEKANEAAMKLIDEQLAEIHKLQVQSESTTRSALRWLLLAAIPFIGAGIAVVIWMPQFVSYGLMAATTGAVTAAVAWTFLSRAGVWLGWGVAAVLLAAVVYAVILIIRKTRATAASKTDQLNVVVKAIEATPAAKTVLKPVIIQGAIDAKVSDALEASVQAVTG
jgi:hypothetical protein